MSPIVSENLSCSQRIDTLIHEDTHAHSFCFWLMPRPIIAELDRDVVACDRLMGFLIAYRNPALVRLKLKALRDLTGASPS